jgi:hypothetical protein
MGGKQVDLVELVRGAVIVDLIEALAWRADEVGRILSGKLGGDDHRSKCVAVRVLRHSAP